MQDMKDKVCVITGGAGSIGLASARQMYDAEAWIMLVDLSEENLATAVASFDDSDRVAICQANISDTSQTQNYVAKTVDKWGKFECCSPMPVSAIPRHRSPNTRMIFFIR